MAVSINQGGTKRSIMDVVKTSEKKQGAGYAQLASKLSYDDIPRQATGIFDLDNAIGGGFPRGKITTIYGKESGGKSMVALKALAQAQIDDPTAKQVILDVELSHDDPQWLSNAVVDMDRLIVFRAETAEDAVDKAEAIVASDDVNFFLFDSLAMLASRNELESAGEKASVGGSSGVISKMFRKVTAKLAQAANEGRYPTVVFINQLRYKIGAMFENPEIQPGGMAPKHMSALTLKVYGKSELSLTDKQGFCVNKGLHSWKSIKITVEKKKIFTTSNKCDFKLCVATTEDGYHPFDCPHWARLESFLKSEGLLYKDEKGKKYKVEGLATPFETLKELRGLALEDPDLDRYLRTILFNHRKRAMLGDLAAEQPVEVPSGY